MMSLLYSYALYLTLLKIDEFSVLIVSHLTRFQDLHLFILQDCKKTFPSALCMGGSLEAIRRLLHGRGEKKVS